ncbi:MAG: SIMPL domain-containing protein [Candidatus Obscuribacterales bacterium]
MAVRKIPIMTLLVFLFSGSAQTAQAELTTSFQNMRTITSSGQAEILVQPDLFTVVAKVNTKNRDVAKAYGENDSVTKKILSLTTKHHISPENVKTDYLNVHKGGSSSLDNDKFHASRRICFQFTDAKLIGPIVEDIINAGGDEIEKINFETTELRKCADQARKLALKAAKEKAIDLAREFDLSVGKTLQIEEFQESKYPWTNYRANNRLIGEYQQGDTINGGIALGKIPVGATVIATFELVEK